MDHRFTCWRTTFAVGFALLVAGCSSIDWWPFGSEAAPERSRAPLNATEYRCDAGKRFYARYLDSGGAAWVILPEREFRLDKVAAASGTRYSNGRATLEVNGNEAALADPPAISFTGCKGVGG